MEEPSLPDSLPPVAFADVWRSNNHLLPKLHPFLRAALILVSLLLQLSVLALLDYHPPAARPQQPAVAMVQLPPYRPPDRLREPTLRLLRPGAQQIVAPQIIIMPDTFNGRGSTGNGPGDSGTSACVDGAYLAEISRHIQQYFFYPVDGTGIHLQGVVYVHFVSNSSGSYQSLQVAKSSGYPALDQAALLIMQRAAPLPMIPDRLHADLVNGVLPIIFELKGSNLSPTWAASGGC